MADYVITFNPDRCISCYACETSCAAKNNTPGDARLGQMVVIGPVKRKNRPRYLNMYVTCFHCAKPWCVQACPTGAMTRREDGLVYVDKALCVGCKACMQACPWRIPQWDSQEGKAIKCDHCRDRLDEGLEPACVEACCGHALEYLKVNEASAKARTAYVEKALLHSDDPYAVFAATTKS
ncbi:4Fe-4S dicluster domain-containing protein [Salidesulfovibrio onnuriiensis]|uniref:4Fe-4S dicluster domain-containing protein n=1 Tax=Salidesulfovibrio onnuriiensis TaxID=2583823 RepID=UPI0011C7DA52|nr:4Fe-4S dicluster domain-containing protein [Salidesulfovibrio onnuriiensis]